MACCRMAPSHNLNQCWLITSEVLRRYFPGGILTGNAQDMIYLWNVFLWINFGCEYNFHQVYEVIIYLWYPLLEYTYKCACIYQFHWVAGNKGEDIFPYYTKPCGTTAYRKLYKQIILCAKMLCDHNGANHSWNIYSMSVSVLQIAILMA